MTSGQISHSFFQEAASERPTQNQNVTLLRDQRATGQFIPFGPIWQSFHDSKGNSHRTKRSGSQGITFIPPRSHGHSHGRRHSRHPSCSSVLLVKDHGDAMCHTSPQRGEGDVPPKQHRRPGTVTTKKLSAASPRLPKPFPSPPARRPRHSQGRALQREAFPGKSGCFEDFALQRTASRQYYGGPSPSPRLEPLAEGHRRPKMSPRPSSHQPDQRGHGSAFFPSVVHPGRGRSSRESRVRRSSIPTRTHIMTNELPP